MKSVLSRLLRLGTAGLLVLASDAGAVPEEQTQRFSIAISGGASKGAYEAGLNWAVIKILRNVGYANPTLGGQFRPTDVASVAGASAGGINTLLSGLSWCTRAESDGGLANRVDDNIFRDVWLVPDINDLLPPRPDSPWYLPGDATLARKTFIDVANDLRDRWNTPAFRPGCRIPLGVTVTRVQAEQLQVGSVQVGNQRFYIPYELRVQADKSAKFFFDPADYPTLSDPAMILLPQPRDAPRYSIDDKDVIEATLATSAFPLGFGRRQLQYCRFERFDRVAEEETKEKVRPVDDAQYVCPTGYSLATAEFADGGLFDNLPIGVARTLAEDHVRARKNPLPVTYIFVDPNRTRYDIPKPPDTSACASDDPPEACQTMVFNFMAESQVLADALGTARRLELFRELTSDNWRLNLSQLGYELGELLKQQKKNINCQAELPYFDRTLDCATALRRTGQLLEVAYDSVKVPVTKPFSVEKLRNQGIASQCRRLSAQASELGLAECKIDINRFRQRFANDMIDVARRVKLTDKQVYRTINRSRLSIHNDRILRVSSSGAPITGNLLGSFAAFLEYKFREYDYYVGVYDAVILSADTVCGLHFSTRYQGREYRECLDSVVKRIYENIGLESSARGRYVFALLAKRELQPRGAGRFAYEPMPPVDRDMQIIHEGLDKSLQAGSLSAEAQAGVFVVEQEFFEHLRAEGFDPTPTGDGEEPLLTQIMAEPDFWATELTRRFSSRLVYLEQQAEEVFTEREPDPEQRQAAQTGLMGAAALTLQTVTYKYPSFAWAPSTAPKDWVWRNVIPYEVAFDFADGDLLLLWNPTWRLSSRNNLGFRTGFAFAGGVFDSSASRNRENYFTLGVDYTRLTGSTGLSGWGVTPAWFHNWNKPEVGDQDTFGFDVHVGFLKNRLRVSLGARDVNELSDTWFLTLGLADLPGITYWLSR